MIKRNFLFFMAPDGTGGAAALGDVHEGEGGNGNNPTPTEGITEMTPPPEPKAPQFDPQAFAKEFGSAFAETHAKHNTPKDESKPMTAEEADKLTNKWLPDDNWFAEFDNLDSRKAAVEKMRDGMFKYADTVTQLRIQQFQQQIEAKYAPVMQMIERQQAEAVEREFSDAYPQLADPKLRPFLNSIAHSLQAEGKNFGNDRAAGFKAIAERAASAIQVTNPDFKLSGAAAPKKSVGNIPVTTSGSGGASGDAAPSGNGAPKGNKALSILGNV